MTALIPLLSARRHAVMAALPAMALVMLAAPLLLVRLREAGVPPVLATLLTMAVLAGLAVNVAGYGLAWLTRAAASPR